MKQQEEGSGDRDAGRLVKMLHHTMETVITSTRGGGGGEEVGKERGRRSTRREKQQAKHVVNTHPSHHSALTNWTEGFERQA